MKTKILNIQHWEFTEGPPMNEAREYHGCTTTTINGIKTVLVVGGHNNGYDVNTMEVYDPSKNEWTLHSSLLPTPLRLLQVVPSRSLKYSAYVIGGWGNGHSQTAIYGLNRNQEWELVGNLKQKRNFHASLNLRKNDIPGCK